MLRITIDDLPDVQRWSLQGRLVAQWAEELSSVWRERHSAGDERKCIVELTDVTFIDRGGEAVLEKMMRQGVQFLAGDVYTEHLLKTLSLNISRARTGNEKGTRSNSD